MRFSSPIKLATVMLYASLVLIIKTIPSKSSSPVTPKSEMLRAQGSIRALGRLVESTAVLGGALCFKHLPIAAADDGFSKFLSRRVTSFDADEYKPGIISDDVYYPSWFLGKWQASSKFTAFEYPLGSSFGGPTKNMTEKELGSSLSYVCKFRPDGKNKELCVSDRLYNVEQIALASIGENCIINDEQMSSDLAESLRLMIRPPNVLNTIYDITLKTTDRAFDTKVKNKYDAMERTLQKIIVQSEFQSKTLIKEIETITSYELLNDNLVSALQRTATFLSPYDSRYANILSQDARVSNTAIDVRQFSVTYRKLN